MARRDDYAQALELGKRTLSDKNPDLVSRLSGAEIRRDGAGNTALCLDFFNRPVMMTWPDLACSYRDKDEEVPIQHGVLLIHYLLGTWSSNGAPLTGDWIAYQEIPDGRFYLEAFLKRARNPLVQGFGENPGLLRTLAARNYGAQPFDHGDVSVLIRALPLVPLVLILWEGDDEFPPEGNILFDRNISRIFSAEDVAWLAGMAVYPLIGMAKSG